MSILLGIFTILAVGAGCVFFIAGTLGLLRFPDALTRLHALTKADNLGLGLILLGLLPQASSPWMAAKMVGVWLLMQLASGAVGQLLAETALGEATPEDRP
ncbi:monovalent cation/H(+) antiporter subunit G [Aquabacter sp. CN5-332]|uniref:monovalent cation/H(+) antiporter subunit G n=1 Tax=Aquabacter sp. CN5-332 TaxID=3156608 RepID=UPI0032B42DC0